MSFETELADAEQSKLTKCLLSKIESQPEAFHCNDQSDRHADCQDAAIPFRHQDIATRIGAIEQVKDVLKIKPMRKKRTGSKKKRVIEYAPHPYNKRPALGLENEKSRPWAEKSYCTLGANRQEVDEYQLCGFGQRPSD